MGVDTNQTIIQKTGAAYGCMAAGSESVYAGIAAAYRLNAGPVCDAQRCFSCRYVACISASTYTSHIPAFTFLFYLYSSWHSGCS